jgi:hypothetical protein
MTAWCRATRQGKHACVIGIEAVRAHRIVFGAYSLVGRWNAARAMGLGCALGELPVCFRWIGFEVGRTGRGRGREGKEDREIRKACEVCTE